MKEYRIVIHRENIYIEFRKSFPWPRWERMKDYFCDGFDIMSRPLVFDTVKSAKVWIADAEKSV